MNSSSKVPPHFPVHCPNQTHRHQNQYRVADRPPGRDRAASYDKDIQGLPSSRESSTTSQSVPSVTPTQMQALEARLSATGPLLPVLVFLPTATVRPNAESGLTLLKHDSAHPTATRHDTTCCKLDCCFRQGSADWCVLQRAFRLALQQ